MIFVPGGWTPKKGIKLAHHKLDDPNQNPLIGKQKHFRSKRPLTVTGAMPSHHLFRRQQHTQHTVAQIAPRSTFRKTRRHALPSPPRQLTGTGTHTST